MSDTLNDNQGFWLNKDGSLDFRTLDMPASPGDDECIVKVLYSGVNPADTKHAALGVYDTVSGYDFCGEVIEAGPHCNFAVGDVIAGANPTGVNRPADFGSHQNYLRCVPDAKAFKVPANMPQVAASCMGVVVRTAADAFFNLLHYPLIDEAAQNPEGILLIWGGTTSIGLSTLQFAKARNVATIFAVALPEQFGMLQNMGVTRCFNFMDSDAVDQIRASARELGQPILNVLDAGRLNQRENGGLGSRMRGRQRHHRHPHRAPEVLNAVVHHVSRHPARHRRYRPGVHPQARG